MTIKEAVKFLNQIKEIILNDKSWLESTHEPVRQSFDMAIKSLEAWEKVKEEIKYHADNIKYTDAYRDGFEVSLKIIDKHLSEVSE